MSKVLDKFLNQLKNFFQTKFFEPRKKLVIIMSGGAMNCAYGAGFLDALSHFQIPKNTIIIAASGNAGNATYFALGETKIGKRVWTESLAGERLISFKRRKVLDIDYLVDVIFKKEFPLNMKKLSDSDVEVVVPATCYETGKVVYFSSKQKDLDWYEVLRAAKALPIIYGKRVLIGKMHYFDTPHSSSWAVHIPKAIDLGATHTIIVDLNRLYKNRIMAVVGEYVVKNYFFAEDSHYDSSQPKEKTSYQKNSSHNIYIRPKHLENNLETDKEKIEKLWQAGYDECMHNQDLKNMLERLQN